MKKEFNMKTVYKYQLRGRYTTGLELPPQAQILSVQSQEGIPTLWALVDPQEETQQRYFRVVGTGWEIEEEVNHIGTYMEGAFVWHVFEII
jgi:hypothetical protein